MIKKWSIRDIDELKELYREKEKGNEWARERKWEKMRDIEDLKKVVWKEKKKKMVKKRERKIDKNKAIKDFK